jgi:hypothetical protein
VWWEKLVTLQQVLLLAWLLHDPRFVLVDAVLIFILFVSYLIGVLWFSNRHPGLALLEGADLIQWRQLEMAAKGLPAAELDEPQQRIASRRGPALDRSESPRHIRTS